LLDRQFVTRQRATERYPEGVAPAATLLQGWKDKRIVLSRRINYRFRVGAPTEFRLVGRGKSRDLSFSISLPIPYLDLT